MKQDKLVIIDGSSLLYRAFFALPLLANSQGVYTNAVYGFLTMLLKLYQELDPQYVAVTFDKGKYTFRTELYEGYKATRKAAPDELSPQFSLVREVLASLGIHVLEMERYEGDDIIGTISRAMEEKGLDIHVITGDRDALQLVSDHTTVHLTKKGISQMLAVTPEVMAAEYGYTPSQVIDMKALMGDTSDNIPGVAGVGEKTALKLIQQFGSVEGVYEHIDEQKGKLKEKLEKDRENAFLSKKLATIDCHVPIAYTLETFLPKPCEQDAKALFKQLGFQQLLDKFGQFDRFSFMKTDEEGSASPKEIPWNENLAVSGKTISLLWDEEKKMLAVASKDGVMVWKEEEAVQAALEAAAEAASILTLDGKGLWKLLRRRGIGRNIRVWDITLGAYLLDPSRTAYGISYICEKYGFIEQLGEEASAKEWLACSALVLLEVQPLMEKELAEKDMLELFETIEIPLEYTLAVMEENGIAVDQKRIQELHEAFSKEAGVLEKKVHTLSGEVFNVNSPKQLGVVLFEKLGLPVIKKVKTGYSTNAEVLEALQDKHPVIEYILQYRTIKKLISTYLEGMAELIDKETGRIHTSFNQFVTATGRLSSSEPNLQNIPVRTELGKEIRSVFVPGAGYEYLVSADYSQIELRLMAHLSQDESMIDAFNKGQDIHRRTAAEVFGLPLEEVTAEQRSHAKAVNFGIIYGISDYGLAKNIKVTREQAKNYIDSYFERYPKIKEYMDGLIQEARETMVTTTMFGRQRILPDIGSKNFQRRSFAERTAINTPIQGSAADIIKIAMNHVEKELEARGLASRLLLQVHDELVLEVPQAELEEVTALLKEKMERVIRLSIPLQVDINIGKNWAEAK